MNKRLLKTLFLSATLATWTAGAWAQGWSTIYSEDYNDPATFNSNGYWISDNTGRYTIAQTANSDGYVMEVAPVGNGSNGTTARYTGLTSANSAVAQYLTADQYRVSFDFNFCYNQSQAPFFQIMNESGTELVGFYCVTANNNAGSVRLGANGSATGGTELGTYTFGYYHATPTTYNSVTIYTENGGTYMDVTFAGETTANKYTIDANNVVHVGTLIVNTKRYWNHFVFDNLNVQIYSEAELVAAPSAVVSAINGASRTITITPQDEAHTVYYYMGDDASSAAQYNGPITISTSGTLHYYSQSASGAVSDTQSLDVNCVEVTLAAPTFYRTGADSYTITAEQPATDGITPQNVTIHYTVNGGTEQTIANGATATGIDGDIVAWAVAEGYTNSANATETFVAAYKTVDVWSYNLNAYPSTYSITAIGEAIDQTSETTLNGLTVYNLLNANCPNLYVENSTGWLLRDRSSNAFKIQNSATSITFNNVDTDNVIYINGVDDNGRYRLASVTNGRVAYSYNNNEYFIVPDAAGAVSVTLNTGVSINTVAVQEIQTSTTVSINNGFGIATFTPSVALDFTNATSIQAYKASVSGDVVTLTKVNTVAAGEGVLIRGVADGATTDGVSEDIPAAAAGTTAAADNAFVGVTSDIASLATSGEGATNYILNAVDGQVGFYQAAGKAVAAGKAYLQLPATASARFISLSFEGETTGINDITAAGAKVNGTYYTLSGLRVNKPTKGLYILNGKKVVVK